MTTEHTPDAGAVNNPPGEQQVADGKTPEAGDAGTKQTPAGETPPEPKPADPPAEIVYEFTAPEGMNLDQDQVTEFTALAKELKLPADKAQAVVDLAIKAEVKRAEAFEATKQQWADEIANDKVLGGDKLDENLAIAKKAYSLLPAEEAESFKQMLNASGFGNHPSMVRLLHAVGKALSEDKFVPGGAAPSGGEQSAAQRMYPNMNP